MSSAYALKNRRAIVRQIIVKNIHSKIALNEKLLSRLASDALTFLRAATKPCSFEIVFVSDRSMRRYNKRYTGRDCLTDVLSFRLDNEAAGRGAFVGDIIVSIDAAKRQCGLFGKSFEHELVLYMVHGILHLFGYDDLNTKDRSRMRSKECTIMAYLSGRQNLSRVLMPL